MSTHDWWVARVSIDNGNSVNSLLPLFFFRVSAVTVEEAMDKVVAKQGDIVARASLMMGRPVSDSELDYEVMTDAQALELMEQDWRQFLTDAAAAKFARDGQPYEVTLVVKRGPDQLHPSDWDWDAIVGRHCHDIALITAKPVNEDEAK